MRPALPVRLCLVAALVGAGALSGCRPGTALHGRYNNFRAYYNTYYNATRSLDAGESALEQQSVTIDRNTLVSVFPATTAGAGRGPFQDAIDKSAELLRNRPSSKWADDALLVIGKAYFYQRNFAGAEQKFRETLTAADAIGDRRLGDEARFWLGRTFAAADRFEEGVAVLEAGLASEGGDRRWTARMELALGELYARAGRWDEAAEALRAGAPDEGDADVAARAYVLLGQVEEHAERWDESAAAFAEALRRKPAYELGYTARINQAIVLGLDADRPQEGLAIILDMRADDKNYDRRGELALIEARLRARAGETDRAFQLFRDVLYEPELNGRVVAGQAHYRLGEFYRDARNDFVRASAHFDSAAAVVRPPEAEARPAAGALLGVADQARVYATLATAARQIAESDSLLALGDLSEEDFTARIEAIEAERLRVYREEQRRLNAARTAAAFAGTGGGAFTEGAQPGAPTTGRTTTSTAPGAALPGTAQDVGFLSYRAPSSVQAGLIAFEQTWGDRPLVPNWRRRAALQAGDIAAARGVVGTETGGFEIGEGPPRLDLSRVPRTPEKRSELITGLASLRYELANAFFLSLGRADTAAALYQSILAETPDLPVAIRAQYALAEIERAAGRDDAARPYYEAVAAADTTALGRASRVRLGLEDEAVEETGPAVPATSPEYAAARARWADGDPIGAAVDLVALADADPDAEGAPRAYLAAATALLEWADGDSLQIVRPLPDSLVSPVLLAVADSLARSGDNAVAAPVRSTPRVAPAPRIDRPAPVLAPVEERVLDSGKRIPGRDGRRTTPAAPPPDAETPPDVETPPATPAETPPADDPPDEAVAPPPVPLVAPPPVVAPPLSPRILAPVDSASFTLRHHLRALEARYAGTPYAARATALVAGLPIPPPLPVLPEPAVVAPDSTTVAPDSTAAVPLAGDDLEDAGQPDAAAEAGDLADGTPVDDADPLAAPAPLEVPGLRGDDPVRPGGDGYTWRVRSLSIPTEGGPMLGVLGDAGFRVAVLREASGSGYAVVLGAFETEEQAQAALPALPAWAQLRGAVVPLADFAPLDGGDPDDVRGDF